MQDSLAVICDKPMHSPVGIVRHILPSTDTERLLSILKFCIYYFVVNSPRTYITGMYCSLHLLLLFLLITRIRPVLLRFFDAATSFLLDFC